MFSVMRQFFDGLVHISQCRVLLLLLEAVENFRLPAFGEFFEGADVQVAVVQIGFQLGHEFDQKTAVLTDGIAAEWRAVFGHILFDEGQNLRFGI